MHAVEESLFVSMRMLEKGFSETYGLAVFAHDIDDKATMQTVTRFLSKDQASLGKSQRYPNTFLTLV